MAKQKQPARKDQVVFFATPAEFAAWLEQNHDTVTELWVGYHKRATGRPSITWQESVDEALCYGWIDGVRKSVDATSYKIRFSPRKPRSTWSAVNVRRVEELKRLGRMRPAGLAAYERRADHNTGIYSYEQRKDARLDASMMRQLRENKKAWGDFQGRPPWYQRAVIHWVMSAKKEETRQKRFAQLLADSAAGRSVPPLTRREGAK